MPSFTFILVRPFLLISGHQPCKSFAFDTSPGFNVLLQTSLPQPIRVSLFILICNTRQPKRGFFVVVGLKTSPLLILQVQRILYRPRTTYSHFILSNESYNTRKVQ